MAPSTSLARYRPAILALTGISAAVAIYLIHQRYLSFSDTPEPLQGSLRRRNAIRRNSTRRYRRETGDSDPATTPSHQAINRLRARERDQDRHYGFLEISTERAGTTTDTDRPLVRLLPSLLPTVGELQEQEGLLLEDTQDIRRHVETVFLHTFFVHEYNPRHTIGPEEADYLRGELLQFGLADIVIEAAIEAFNEDPDFGAERRRSRAAGSEAVFQTDGTNDRNAVGAMLQALDGRETLADDQSEFSWREGVGDGHTGKDGQNMLNLLYHIAEDQARKDGYIHRGIECNSCGVCPIQGIRYRCANCLDFDLCENCEAMQVHIKTHVFYKVRIPAPTLGSRQGLPVWYPGKPASLPRSLPRDLSKRLLKETGLDNSEMEALWDQFRCLAGFTWANDPNKLGMAIDRIIFDKCFVPPSSLRSPPPNLIYDRMFAFYDTNNDGLIGFEEFLKGLANLHDKTRAAKLRRIFRGYDMDNDGFVDRKDFLRIFRAYYSLCKEINREMVAGMEEDFIEGGVREVIQSSQPISSAFPGSIPPGHASRGGAGKELNSNGDLEITDNHGVLEENSSDTGHRHQAVADAAVGHRPRPHPFRTFRTPPVTDSPLMASNAMDLFITHEDDASEMEDGEDLPFHTYGWPPINPVQAEDILNALGRAVPFEEIMDPVDRSRVFFAQSERLDAEARNEVEAVRNRAIQNRWQRRNFYTDIEEGATAPPGYTEADSSDEEFEDAGDGLESPDSVSDSRPASHRSRSSSKVRFEDGITDTEYETRSNTSARSIPVGERWGGFEISAAEKDVGKEILYQAVQQGFNELLDQLFKDKEDLAMAALKTTVNRVIWSEEISKYEDSLSQSADGKTPKQLSPSDIRRHNSDVELDGLLDAAGYSVGDNLSAAVEMATNGDVLQMEHMIESPSTERPLGSSEFTQQEFPSSTGEATNEAGNEAQSLNSPTPGDDEWSEMTTHSAQESVSPPSPRPDPTLPQNRPNSLDFSPVAASIVANPGGGNPLSPSTPRSARLAALNSIPSSVLSKAYPKRRSSLPLSRHLTHPVSPGAAEARPSSPPPTTVTLAIWVKHKKAEAEAKQRGGWGKLDFEEFSERMVDEEKEADGSNNDKGKKWGSSSSMGKLGFVETWIEMASF